MTHHWRARAHSEQSKAWQVICALITAVAFAVAFTGAQLYLQATSCHWLEAHDATGPDTEPKDKVWINMRQTTAIYEGGTHDGKKVGSVIWFNANPNNATAVAETPVELIKRCGG